MAQIVIKLVFLLVLLTSQKAEPALSPDFEVLLAFKQQLDATGSSKLDSWVDEISDNNPCGRWEGVTCADNSTAVVKELHLRWRSLRGAIPVSFGSLDGLEVLDLSDNYLSGPIPPEIGGARKLRKLDFSRNLLTGRIPSTINQLVSLEELGMVGNLLSGVIPGELLSLANLTHLYLSRNLLTGPIPDVGRLTNLQELFLDGNGLMGTLPKLNGLANLTQLSLNDNHFTGEVPNLEGLTRLERLHLESNKLSGRAPDLVGLKALQELDLSNNRLQGSLPSGIAEMAQLRYLNLSSNFLSGGIPADLWSNCSGSLVTLDLSGNELNGSIPGALLHPNMAKLQYLNLAYNNLGSELPKPPAPDVVSGTLTSVDFSSNLLQGPVPEVLLWAGMLSLAYLNLSSNNFSGGILLSPGWPDGLETLDLSNNGLDGSIPPDIGSTSWAGSLQRLWLHNNSFSGDIDHIWSLQQPAASSLRELRLQHNQFHGTIGRVTLGSWKNLHVLDLSHNLLSLDISSDTPALLDSLPNLRELRLGNNNSTGTLPSTARGAMLQLQVLDLSSSNLRGQLNAQVFSINALPFLSFLDLSDNQLTGAVPAGLPEIANLTYMDLSGNRLSGPLPLMPHLLSRLSFFSPGNEGLCGSPMPACPPPTLTPASASSGIALWQLLATVAACFVVSIASCALLIWRWLVYSKRHRQDADLIAALQECTGSTALMPLRDLRRATSNFSESFQIGVGGFGTVYSGKLPDGTMVAIKRSKRQDTALDKQQFLNEVKILSQVNHRNLVRLLGCCLENKVALLVFEFIPNGTLREHLRSERYPRLSWRHRLQIAVQTADALAYLHSAANPPIFHRDVKSANVLLDNDLNAKVSDFGISKLAPTLEATHVSTAVHGTIGYIDPEYYSSLQLTGKSDVYSFGVVLLELVSGQAAVDFRRGFEGANLVSWALQFFESGVVSAILDPVLVTEPEQMQSIVSVAELAAKCLKARSKDRPCMRDVVRELQSLWMQLRDDSGEPQSLDGSGHISGSSDSDDECLEEEQACHRSSVSGPIMTSTSSSMDTRFGLGTHYSFSFCPSVENETSPCGSNFDHSEEGIGYDDVN